MAALAIIGEQNSMEYSHCFNFSGLCDGSHPNFARYIHHYRQYNCVIMGNFPTSSATNWAVARCLIAV